MLRVLWCLILSTGLGLNCYACCICLRLTLQAYLHCSAEDEGATQAWLTWELLTRRAHYLHPGSMMTVRA